jgi:hypothetical protein
MAVVQGRSGGENSGSAACQGGSQTEDQQHRTGHEHKAKKQHTLGFQGGFCVGEQVYPFRN